MDRLKKYDFLDENGHSLEDCADYQAIFSEHEAELARVKAAGIEAMRRAEQAEANVARLTKERDWLANKLSDHCLADGGDCNIPTCPTYIACRNATSKVWIEAASRAVAAGEEPCQK